MSEEAAKPGWFFYACYTIGGAISLFGVWTLVGEWDRNHPVYAAGLLITSNIVHDAVIAPAVCGVGYVLRRVVPERIRTQVTWAMFASAVVLAVGFAPLRGYGRRPDNATVLPLDYSTAVLSVLAVVWMIAVFWFVLSLRRRDKAEPAHDA